VRIYLEPALGTRKQKVNSMPKCSFTNRARVGWEAFGPRWRTASASACFCVGFSAVAVVFSCCFCLTCLLGIVAPEENEELAKWANWTVKAHQRIFPKGGQTLLIVSAMINRNIRQSLTERGLPR